MSRPIILAALALLSACARQPEGGFSIRVLPAETTSQAATADSLTTLRFLGARAAVRGESGVDLRLPPFPEGRTILDYPEEAQAVARAVAELKAARPVIESPRAPLPFDVKAPLEARAWRRGGRVYLLIVNPSDEPAALASEPLTPWRALFAVRSDARELLERCGDRRCMPARGVLWLEGRPDDAFSLE